VCDKLTLEKDVKQYEIKAFKRLDKGEGGKMMKGLGKRKEEGGKKGFRATS